MRCWEGIFIGYPNIQPIMAFRGSNIEGLLVPLAIVHEQTSYMEEGLHCQLCWIVLSGTLDVEAPVVHAWVDAIIKF